MKRMRPTHLHTSISVFLCVPFASGFVRLYVSERSRVQRDGNQIFHPHRYAGSIGRIFSSEKLGAHRSSLPASSLYGSVFASSSHKQGKRSHRSRSSRLSEGDLISRPIYSNALQRWFYSFIMRLVVLATCFIMRVLNKTILHDDTKQLEILILNRKNDTGLLTVSNHVSMADDPGIWCGTLPLRALVPTRVRSVLMVEEFYYALGSFTATFFHRTKCLPIRRGSLRGLESPGLEALHARLNGFVQLQANRNERQRQWCHIMVEGRVLQPWRFDSFGRPRLGRLRHGAAKVIASSPPSKTIVLPIFHDGMHQLLPETPPENTTTTVRSESGVIPENKGGKTERWIPRIGKRVDVFVGEPVDFKDLVPPDGLPFAEKVDQALLHAISDRLRTALLELEQRAADNRKKIEQS